MIQTDISNMALTKNNTVVKVSYSGSCYENGRYTEGTALYENVLCSVQNPTRDGSINLSTESGGDRLSNWKVIYCEPNTFSVSEDESTGQSDKFVYNNSIYQVRKINNWTSQVLNHDQVFAVRIEEFLGDIHELVCSSR